MTDSLEIRIEIRISTSFIDGRDDRGRYKYQYEAKIVVTSSVDLIPFVIYHYVDNNGKKTWQYFENEYPRMTIGTPSPKRLAMYILNFRPSIEERHIRADDLAEKLIKVISNSLKNYKVEIADRTPDFVKIRLIPR